MTHQKLNDFPIFYDILMEQIAKLQIWRITLVKNLHTYYICTLGGIISAFNFDFM